MSGTTLRMLISFSGILAVFWAVQHVANNEQASIEIAQNKEQLLQPQSKIHHTEKVRGPLSSEISLVGAAFGKPGQAFVLKATVSAAKSVSNAKFKWLLPPAVRLVNGTIENTIAEVSPEHPYTVQITVQQNDSTNQQIHFVVSGEQPGIHFSSVSQYNTIDEDFIQQQKDIVFRTLNQRTDQKRATTHIFH